MKILLLILSSLTTTFLYSQSNAKFDSTISFFKEKGIRLNTVTPLQGFNVYYNCDSVLFIRGNFEDTIKIWTPIMDWYQNLEEFKELLKNERFGKTQFAKSINSDGGIYVSSYHQTKFIYRNDSLYEIQNSNLTSDEPLTNLFSSYFSKQIDDATYKNRLDSLTLIEEKQAIYTPKLIFAKKMFLNNKRKVKLSRKINFYGDTIELENKWTKNGKTCYLVRINNKTKEGEKTSYAYAIDQDMKFVLWEGCNRDKMKL